MATIAKRQRLPPVRYGFDQSSSSSEELSSNSSSEDESSDDEVSDASVGDDDDEFDGVWNVDHGTAVNHIPFNGPTGKQVDTSNYEIFDYVKLFITDDTVDMLVIETNRYAAQFIESSELKINSRVKAWENVTVTEMWTFLGISCYMGIVKKPKIALYWSTDPFLSTPVVSKYMKRNRYQLILKFLHFNDNTNLPPVGEKIARRKFMFEPITSQLLKAFETVVLPPRDVSMDESLLKFHGNLAFKNYLPLKRARYGIKLYKICFGTYTWTFRIYFGHDNTNLFPENDSLTKTEKLVMNIVQPLFFQGHVFYFDRYYSSPNLYLALHGKGTLACGTVMPNRKNFPKDLVAKKLAKNSHDVVSMRCHDILVSKYADKRDVYMISTFHSHSVQSVSVKTKNGMSEVNKPNCIIDYNKNMGSVDLCDSVANTYTAARKTMKWTKKLFFYLLTTATLNAHHVHSIDGGKLKFFDFILAAIKPMMQQSMQLLAPVGPMGDDDVRFTQRHFPQKIPPSSSGKSNPSRNCKMCTSYSHTAYKSRKETVYYCPDCPSKPALCVGQCFMKYHTK